MILGHPETPGNPGNPGNSGNSEYPRIPNKPFPIAGPGRDSTSLGLSPAISQAGPDEWCVCVRVEQAVAVCLMGTFNNWSTSATPMRQIEPGRWSARLRIDPTGLTLSVFIWEQGRPFGRILRTAFHHHTPPHACLQAEA